MAGAWKSKWREARAVELKTSGATYQQIADELGYKSRAGAWHAVDRALARRTAQAVDDYRAITLHDLDLLESKMWRAATAGDLRAITQTLRVMDQRARLLRLFDKPEQQALDATTEEPGVGRRPKRPVALVGPIVVT
jgi:hypothetical protein